MYTHRSQGFTLIELLVVIAIIGILSAVVLASLNTARSKGNDAAIQSDLGAIATQAEIYYGGTGVNTYGSDATNTGAPACPTTPGTVDGTTIFTDPIIVKAIVAAKKAGGSNAVTYCVSHPTTYVVEARLVAPSTAAVPVYWCIDSAGTVGPRTTAIASTDTICPTS